MPFNPSGTWEASVQGTLLDSSQFVGPMVVRLSILGEPYRPPHNQYLLVELSGTWEWGGLRGQIYGFWDGGPTTDQAARDSEGRCPMFYTVCSLNLSLEPPLPEVCGELGGLGELAVILLQGWFEGPTRMVAAELKGTYWQGPLNRPCSGPVLISLDTNVVLERR